MRVSRLVAGCLFALGFVSVAATASADSVIYSNLGPGDSYSTAGWFFGYSLPNGENGPSALFWRAMQFQPQTTATLQTVSVPLFWDQLDPANAGAVQVVLYTSNDRLSVPGSILETFTFGGSSGPTLVTLHSMVHPLLTAGDNYFLAVQSMNLLSGAWLEALNFGLTSAAFQSGVDFQLGPWDPSGVDPSAAFRLTGNQVRPTPEPATGLLVLGGVAGLLRRRRA